MFYEPKHFAHVFAENEAKLAARVANEALDKYGQVLYGYRVDGITVTWHEARSKNSSLAGILIGEKEISQFEYEQTNKRTDSLEVENKALKERLDILDKEVRQLREIQGTHQ